MDEKKFLAERFEANRTHLRAVAFRMLGSAAEADDAVQEGWLRLARSDTSDVGNLGGWLTTVVARVSLDMLRSRKSRREETIDTDTPEPVASAETDHDMLMAESIGLALLVVLDTLAPAERVAFVLHDMFDLPFEEIAPIVGRSEAAARQLASRARRRVQGKEKTKEPPRADLDKQRQIVEAFLAASRAGDFEALLTMLDPDVVFRPDTAAMRMGNNVTELHGAEAVAQSFKGRAQTAKPALVDGAVSVTVSFGGHVRIVLGLTFAEGKIAAIDAIADPARIAAFDVETLDD
ncbi:MAG TPA: sigma-70 family RNA polymerase sigma factor [Pseudolabrys sp.]|jgi:RNA polymerase sigma-70 factor (ECF subfamily)